MIKKKFKKKKKKLCVPVGYGHGKADGLRTLYDLNLIFADVNVNQYDTVGGYGCKPLYGSSSGHNSHGTHGSHGSNQHTGSHHGSHGSTGSHHGSNNYGSSNYGGSNYGSHIDTDTDSVIDSDHDYVNQNDHGSLIQTDDYDHESSVPSQSSQNLFGGLFHGTTNNNYNNNNHGNSHGSGGPLGFFGQGGLFDFSNSGGQRPQTSGALGDSIDDSVKPIIEINVPDTIQDVVSLPSRFIK